MNSPIRIALFVLAIALGAWLLIGGVRNVYFTPHAEIRKEIQSLSATVSNARDVLRDQPRTQNELQSLADRTLGGSKEVVDHELRSHLNRIAEQIGLVNRSVQTGKYSVLKTPADKRFSGRNDEARARRDRIDFVTLEGSISGEGTLEQIVALIDRIEAQPWFKHITHVKLDPKDNGTRLTFNVRLETLFIPGREPSALPSAAYDPRRLERFARLVNENIFRIPPPAPTPDVQPKDESKPPPPEFPWQEWTVTGVARSAGADELWLRNRSSGETRILRSGDSIHEAQLVRAEGESAVFRLGEGEFRVQIGQNLSDRAPLEQ